MTVRVVFALVVVAVVGCSNTASANSVRPDDVQAFCELTVAIDEIYADADDRQLTPEAEGKVDVRVGELAPLIPAAYVDDYRLRYWPTTDVQGLDTSGVSAQRSFDRMTSLFDETCESR